MQMLGMSAQWANGCLPSDQGFSRRAVQQSRLQGAQLPMLLMLSLALCWQVYLLGPNGQPRKVPAALLAAGPDAVQQYAADEELGAESLPQQEWMRAVVPPIRS